MPKPGNHQDYALHDKEGMTPRTPTRLQASIGKVKLSRDAISVNHVSHQVIVFE